MPKNNLRQQFATVTIETTTDGRDSRLKDRRYVCNRKIGKSKIRDRDRESGFKIGKKSGLSGRDQEISGKIPNRKMENHGNVIN